MFDFGALPPEVTSASMYAGPGSGPMLAAAAGWSGLAADLDAVADSYRAVIVGLTTGPWQGPSALAMAAAASQYSTWLSVSAAQAGQTAVQANAAAAAFETAFAMIVPPPLIAANRVQLLALTATNFFGQNTPAIAATEMQYAAMWVQDSVAMYGYAAASAAASRLTPFAEPPETTRPVGLAGQAAAAAKAAVVSGAAEVEAMLAQVMAKLVQALQALTGATDFAVLHLIAKELKLDWKALTGVLSKMKDVASSVGGKAESALAGVVGGLGIAGATLGGGLDRAPAALGAGLGGASARAGQAVAGMGKAGAVGRMSVPPSWAAAPHAMGVAATGAPAVSGLGQLRAGVSALPDLGSSAVPPTMLGGMPGAQTRSAQQATRRVPVIPRMPSAG